MKHSKNTKEKRKEKIRLRVEYLGVPVSSLFHICNEVIGCLCSYIVSKALLKKHTIFHLGEGLEG